jgi:alkylation response protein AidB-like acyl-CoA dehydrogenase
MNFTLTDDQLAMRDSLRRYLADEPAPSWAALCELGVMAALLPEDRGGIGGSGADIALVLEELGRACVTSPVQACLMASVFEGNDEALLSGQVIAPAIYEEGGRYDHRFCETVAITQGGKTVLNGTKSSVPDTDVAEAFAVSAMLDSKAVVVLVPRESDGLEVRATSTIDERTIGSLVLNTVSVRGAGLVGSFDQAVAIGIMALGAEALGLMDAVRDMTVDYLKQRKQFGKELASFQVLQHRLADMAMAIEQVRSSVINAAFAFDAYDGKLTAEFHALKHLAGEVGRLVTEEAIQLHGGIGMTEDYALGKYAKRLIMLDHQLGDADWHLMRFADLSKAEAAQ